MSPNSEKDAPQVQKPSEAKPDGTAKPVEQAFIRVNVELLEDLMTLASELVLTRNQLVQKLNDEKNSRFKTSIQRLNHITSDLQDKVMKTRMQAIESAWAKFPRLIRDLSKDLNKKVILVTEGGETELDRHLLEYIKDPLTHMMRNAVDHGIELPEERIAQGKGPEGTIHLSARHQGGYIIMEMSDDGKGISTKKIRQKAIEKGVVTSQDADLMSDKQLQQLIFAAGFSTAEAVTNVSGRGVGMDVVKNNIEKIGGNVELQSVEGKGSKFIIRIPLTLAIVSSLIVEVKGQRFVIPQINVRELVRVSKNSQTKIEYMHGTAVLQLRDSLLALISLEDLLMLTWSHATIDGQESPPPSGEASFVGREKFVVVVQVGDQYYGLIVDKVFDAQEIVVKPMSPLLKGLKVYSGCTILGDGSVIMILDLNGILSYKGDDIALETKGILSSGQENAFDVRNDKINLLLFKVGDGDIKAVPLALVTRLEEIDFGKLDATKDRCLVHYRRHLMPLGVFEEQMRLPKDGVHPVLVFSEGNHYVGMVIDELHDVVDEHLALELRGERPGILGSCIIQEKTVEIVDVDHYLQHYTGVSPGGEYGVALPDSLGFGESAQERAGESPGGDISANRYEQKYGQSRRLLLVDDSAFFRKILTPSLKKAGYTVVAVEDALKALELAQKGVMFDAIISDIEMPHMNGFAFAERVREPNHPWHHLPMVALSTIATEQAFQRGREVGFTDYIAKFDRDKLFDVLTFAFQDAAHVA